MEEFLGFLIAMTILMAIGAVIHAIFLRAAAKWVANQSVGFGRAYAVAICAALLGLGLGAVLGLLAGLAMAATQSVIPGRVTLFAQVPLGFMIEACLVWRVLGIRFPRACLVTLVATVVGMVVTGVIAAVVTLGFYALMAATGV